MDGATLKAGAVAALQGFESPILAARAVMEKTPHVMLAGEGAMAFAREQGLKAIDDPATWFTQAGAFEANHAPEVLPTGTVGCVVRDAEGRLAAATSTAGVFGKLPGRVGDAHHRGRGLGRRPCGGVVHRPGRILHPHRRRRPDRPPGAVRRREPGGRRPAAIQGVAELGGHGGLIAVDRDGNVAMPFASSGLKRAALLPDGSIVAEAF
jgi:isoaspartyl peptidase/L-asparaginase-like protein (Ntn-hydrolase superfamily)